MSNFRNIYEKINISIYERQIDNKKETMNVHISYSNNNEIFSLKTDKKYFNQNKYL
jgi:hypothetical protein